MKQYLIIITIILVVAAGCLFGGYRWGQGKAVVSVVHDTTVVTKTITYEKPTIVDHYITQEKLVYVPSTDTLVVRDTIYLPKEIKVYKDSLYECQISGYQPTLDWIKVQSRTEYIHTVETKLKPTRWGLGIQIGCGFGYADKFRGVPYVGIGISYNLITW